MRYGFFHEGKAYVRVGDSVYPLLEFARMVDMWRSLKEM